MHRILSVCPLTYENDLDYWGFNELFLDPCCYIGYFVEKEECEHILKGERIAKKRADQRLMDEDFGNSFIGRTRTYLWNLTEYPETSIGARVS